MDRKLFVIGVLALAAMVALSGCIGGGDSSADVIEFVPNENVDGVFHVDMAILEDQTTEDLMNELIEMQMEDDPNYEGPESYDEIWEEFEQDMESDFDPRDLNEAVVFGSAPEDSEMEENQYGAAILSADWTEDEVVDLVEENATVESGEYNGVPFYTVETEDEFGEMQTNYMAVLQEGVYSFGEEQAVRDTVDVAQGDADTLSGELREELDRVRDGYINFAVTVPEDAFSDMGSGQEGSGPDFSAFEDVSVVSGSYYTEGDTMGMSANVRAGSTEDAQDIADAIDGMVALTGMTFGEEASNLLDPLEVERDESTVITTYETTADELVERLESLEEAAGPGQPPGGVDDSRDSQDGEFQDDFGGSSDGDSFGE